jgi:TatA/E family protein of Tat protein translocase
MDLFAPRHLLIVLVVCLLVFGTKKLKTLGSEIGSAVRGLEKAMSEGDTRASGPSPRSRSLAAPQIAASGTTPP